MAESERQRLSVTIPTDLHTVLRELAKQHQRSVTGEIVYALRQYAEAQKKERERPR